MPLESILGPEVTSLIAYATAILTAFGLLYGGAKILWTKATGRAFPSNRLTRTLDALVELGSNVLGFVNKVKRADGSPLIPNPDVVARDALIADLRAALAQAPAPLSVVAEKAGAVEADAATRPASSDAPSSSTMSAAATVRPRRVSRSGPRATSTAASSSFTVTNPWSTRPRAAPAVRATASRSSVS